MTKACLLFDLDNTLIDRESAFRAYLESFIIRNRQAFSDEDIALACAKIIALDCRGKKDRNVFCREVLQQFPRLSYTPDSLWTDHMSMPDFVQADDALHEMLERLAANYQLMILSNGSGNMQRRKMQRAGLTDFFEHILISGEVGYEKPAHRFFLHAQELCTHASIIMVGDDYVNDIQPAIAMRWKTIHITHKRTRFAAPPDIVLTNIHGLEEALQHA